MSIAELILNSNLYFPHPFIKDYSHVKKHCYLCSQPHCYQALLLTLLLTMLIRVQVKLLLKVKLSMHLVLLLWWWRSDNKPRWSCWYRIKSGQKSLPVDVTIHLQDCILSDGTNTVDKVKITFSSASVDATDSNLLKNTLEGNIGGATDVGVRLVKSDNTNVTLGTPITINFPTTNSTVSWTLKPVWSLWDAPRPRVTCRHRLITYSTTSNR